MLQKNIWKSFFSFLGCSIFILFAASVVHSSRSHVLADDEKVIVRANQPISEGKRIGNTDYYLLSAKAARNLTRSQAVSSYAVQSYKTTTTNDPLEPQAYLTLLAAADAWNITTGSSDTVVAVIDTSFALQHEDLEGRWFINEAEYGPTNDEGPEPNCTSRGLELDKSCNNIDDSSNGLVDDWRGWDFYNNNNSVSAGETNPDGSGVQHGTMVSGMVGATGDNGVGIASINWQTTILPIQVFNDDGAATTFELAEGLSYAIEMGADVINMSLGTTGFDMVIEDLLLQARDEGIVVVAAAGNCGGSNYALNGCSFQGQMLYPATSEYTITVGGTTFNDEQASFSSEGEKMDIAAPATGQIRTTRYNKDNELGAYSLAAAGTSFAAPIVSGLAASILSLWPQATPTEVRDMLVDTALRVSEMDGDVFTDQHGFGRIRPSSSFDLTENCKNSTITADINCDGLVDLLDLSLLATYWQVERTGRSDINNSGVVDLLDLSILASNWGERE